jgi:hypothetical protein
VNPAKKGLRPFFEFDKDAWLVGLGWSRTAWRGRVESWDIGLGLGPISFGIEWNRGD